MIQIIALLILMGASSVQAMEGDGQDDDLEAQRSALSADRNASDDERLAGPSTESKPKKKKKRKKVIPQEAQEVREILEPVEYVSEEEEQAGGCFDFLKAKSPEKKNKERRLKRSKSTTDVRKVVRIDSVAPSSRVFWFRQDPNEEAPIYQNVVRRRGLTRAILHAGAKDARAASIQEQMMEAQMNGDIVPLLHGMNEIQLDCQGKLLQVIAHLEAKQAKDSNKQKLYSLGLSAGSLAVMLISFLLTKYVL